MSGNANPPGDSRSPGGHLTRLLLFLCGLVVALFLFHPWSLAEKLFAVAYGLDPQRPSHTYFLGGRQLPLEARKIGMFGGFLVTYVGLLAAGRGRVASFPPRSIMLLLASFIALMAGDGLNATLFDLDLPRLYTPDLRLRLATGLLTGVAMAGLLLPAINGSLWREIRLVPSLATGRDIGGALLLCVSVFILVDARPALLYYPVALLGVAGLVTELMLINTIFVLILTRRVGMAGAWWDAVPVAARAFLLAVCELLVMAALRDVLLGDVTRLM